MGVFCGLVWFFSFEASPLVPLYSTILFPQVLSVVQLKIKLTYLEEKAGNSVSFIVAAKHDNFGISLMQYVKLK